MIPKRYCDQVFFVLCEGGNLEMKMKILALRALPRKKRRKPRNDCKITRHMVQYHFRLL